jgi:uncharacterized membrane protein YhaH (DUF805 family)
LSTTDPLARDPRLGPAKFFAIGVTLFIVKFVVDRLVATLAFGRPWSVLNYLIPVESVALLSMSRADRAFYSTMLAVALPFVAVGLIVTLRRLRDAGLSQALALLFFIPAANLLFFAALSVIPSARARHRPIERGDAPVASTAPVLEYGRDEQRTAQRVWSHLLPESAGGSAVVSALIPVPFSLLLAYLAARVFRGYGFGIFIAMPFMLGLVSAILHGYRAPRTKSQCAGVAALSLLASGIAMISFAIEGLGCLIMLAPLAIPVALMGGALGYSIQARPDRDAGSLNTLWSILLIMPLLTGAESIRRDTPSVFVVTTCMEVNAPPARVWQNVVSFSDIPQPRDWVFRAGVAYPVRARIDGAGVGAIRHCEFSTGEFVEPIEIWDEPRLLKFAVTSNPPAMKEWSPFDIHPPHLENFLVSHGGQFRLIELPDGRTRLEGTTWYEHRLWPETYWRWWSDHIIHRIHYRVLEHVRSLAEQRVEY